MKQRAKIWVTGSGGQLGMELQDLALSFPQFEFLFTPRREVPIDQSKVVEEYFAANKPDYLINCAAYTAVDRAEEADEHDNVFGINAHAVQFMAKLCKHYRTKLIQLSTDYVFDGAKSGTYDEDDKTNPLNVYGASKLKGEQWALENTDAIVLRSSWLYSVHGNNFVKSMIKLLDEKKELKVVNDQLGSPTYAADLAAAILQIISSGKWQSGIFHYANEGSTTWYGFASAIRELTGSKCNIIPIKTGEFPRAAKRPVNSVLGTEKIQKVYGTMVYPWKERLVVCMKKLSNH